MINTFSKNNTCIFKNGIQILVGRAILKLWIKTVKIMFWSVTQELLGLLLTILTLPFLRSLDNWLQYAYYFSKRCFNFEIEHKTCLFLVRGAVPLSRGKGTPNQNFSMLCALFQNYQHSFEEWCILKQIVWETQKYFMLSQFVDDVS